MSAFFLIPATLPLLALKRRTLSCQEREKKTGPRP